MAQRGSGGAAHAVRAGNDNHRRAPATPEQIAAAGALAIDRPARVTLDLDPARHLRLRLACAIGGRSAKAVLIDALDAHLKTIADIERHAAAAMAHSGEAATMWGTDQ